MTYPAPEKPIKDEWFDDAPHPYDSWPMAKDKTPVERLHDDMRKEYENPRPEEEIADNYSSRHESTPDFEKSAEEIVTMHEKMYRMARAKYNPFAIGGSESILDKK
tara:strand:- start:52 stop:369 length:318 start_codon:yes stop_codon:yes gene_type:complete